MRRHEFRPGRGGGYFNNRVLEPVQPPPANLDWDLWQSGVQPLMDYRPNCAPVKWRSWWNYGSGGLGDWGCHLLDVLFYAYGELDSPASVKAQVKDKVTEYFPCPHLQVGADLSAFLPTSLPPTRSGCITPMKPYNRIAKVGAGPGSVAQRIEYHLRCLRGGNPDPRRHR